MKKPEHHKTMLITGAGGFIGARLASAACACGYAVKTLSRSLLSIPSCICDEHRYVGNFPENIPAKAVENVNVIVHCAAWVKSGQEMAQAVNVEGTVKLAKMALQQKVETFIFLSSQSARVDAISDYGRSKYAAEQALLSRFSNTGLKIIIVRPGLVTGPGHQGLYLRLCRMVDSWPILPLLDGGKSIVQPIHIDDLCDAILRCWEVSDQLNGKRLNLGHHQGASLAQFLQALAVSRRGSRRLAITIPIWPVTVAVRLAEGVGLSLPITSENLKGLTKVENMETESDMALIGVPIRPLEIILRDQLDNDPALLREAVLITRYLLRLTPSYELQLRYSKAIDRLKIELDQDERRLWRVIERCPSTLRMIDSGLALLKPQGGIRRKIYTMLAILEASSEHCERFLPRPCSSAQMIRLIGLSLRAGFSALMGFFIIYIVKVKLN